MNHSTRAGTNLPVAVGLLATILLLTCVGCTSGQSDKGKTLSGNRSDMMRVQAAQTKAITDNARIPPAARAAALRSMEASRAQSSRMPRLANHP